VGHFELEVDPAADANRIRIFKPNVQWYDNWVVGAGATAIIGPELGSSAELEYELMGGTGITKFAVEGIEFGTDANIVLTWVDDWSGDEVNEQVSIRVAPFKLLGHSRNVDVDDPPTERKTVYVTSFSENYDLRVNYLRKKYNAEPDYVTGHLDEASISDEWHQDGYEVGYVEAPYVDDPVPIFLVSPRAKDRSNSLRHYVHNDRLQPDVGVCWELEYITDWTTFDKFGDVEYGLCGKSLHEDIRAFFQAQDAGLSEIDTDWLDIGHVDEIISSSPFGHTIVADPETCWGMLLWVCSDSPSAMIAGHGVLSILTDKDKYHLNVDPDPPQAWFDDQQEGVEGIMEQQNLPMSLSSWDSQDPIPQPGGDNTGDGELSKAGVFVADLPDGVGTRTYRVWFNQGNNSQYTVWWKDDDDPDWSGPDTDIFGVLHGDEYEDPWYHGWDASYIRTNADCVFNTAKCYILEASWDRNYRDLIAPDDKFFFTFSPGGTTIEMPVLFEWHDYYEESGWVVAYTINHVNCLVDGETVFTGDPQEYGTSVFSTYVEKLFKKAGYTNVKMPNSWWYHSNSGNIHCGTNVRRSTP